MDIVTYALCMGNDNYILDIVKAMERLTMVVQDTVPTVATAEPNKLYLVDTNHDGVYEEFILAEVGGVQKIIELGNITDLTDYYTKEEIDEMFSKVHIQCTPAEYELLTPEQKTNGSEYFVYDPIEDKGMIYRNGHLFGSPSEHMELTQAQYDALTPAEKNNGMVYFITDAQAEGDFSDLERRLLKMEDNFIAVSPNVDMINPAAYVSMTKISDNEVHVVLHDSVTNKNWKVIVTAQGSGNTRTNPQYRIEEVV